MKKGISRIPSPYDLNAIMPFIMKRRCDSQVFYNVDFNVGPLLAWIDENKVCTFFQAMLLALVKTMRERPGLNRFVMGRRLYQREDMDICFIARRAYTDEGSETSVKMRVKQEYDDKEVIARIIGGISEAKEGAEKDDDAVISLLIKLPGFVLRAVVNILTWLEFHMCFPKSLEKIDPLHCSAFVANLGSVGIEAPFHHLYEWGTCSLFVAIGKIGKKLVPDESGAPAVRNMVEVKVTLDERIADGYYFARSLDIFKSYVENPETLFESSIQS
ncbi:MAG: 2-oxo acid dehydrogenase subunit E2 [Clostridiales bacterium]|nr:2-oxo acid dehydrogenase subunit E2 [Clostridiales bacterium]